MIRSNNVLVIVILGFWISSHCQSFAPKPTWTTSSSRQQDLLTKATTTQHPRIISFTWHGASSKQDEDLEPSTAKMTLEEKMKSWEATEDEVKKATLGGLVPGRSDAFDVGLYIAFPLMVLSGLLFALFPLIMDNLDVDSVGPPPTV